MGKLACFLLMLAAFVYSMTAPGNAVRGQTLSGGMSAVKAILESFYFGMALMSRYFSPALAALWLATVLLLRERLMQSRFSFRYPLLAVGVFVCLYCCQLTPTLYTGNYLGDGRAQVLQYDNYVLLSTALVVYLAGWALKRYGTGQVSRPPTRAGAAAAAALLLLGMMSFQRTDGQLPGVQNTLTVSTLRSLVSGQAAAFDEAMTRRDAEMNDTSVRAAQLEPVEDIPEAFMGEVLDTDMKNYVLSLYAEYYQKDSVALKTEAQDEP